MKAIGLAAIALCLLPATDRGAESGKRADSIVATLQDQKPRPAWYQDLDTWLAAVDRHEAGRADEAAATVASWLPERLTLTLSDVVGFRRAMATYRQRPTAVIRVRSRPFAPDDIENLFRITSEERLRADLNRVLRRAAVLHADIAVFARDLPRPVGGRDVLVRLSDGRQAAVDSGSGHWRFGRELVAALVPDLVSFPFTRAWYLATGAYLQNDVQLTLADEHLAAARRVLPDDPEILFAGACALETLASRRVQGELSQVTLPAPYTLEHRAPRPMEDDAIALFGKALATQPDRYEARIRMARLVGLHGRHDEAAADLRKALQRAIPEVFAYFGWLFLGDEELALAHREEAARAYERAAELFPDSPSPVIALARLAREHGDREAVASALQRWWALPANGPDPWRDYYMMQGGDYEDRMARAYSLAAGRRR